ncbi:putative kinetochore protein Spc25 isoform 4 [Scophthalmus maximus]|uniref:Kinetochore protein SPC25 n=1 Tax=Scophthalmus maximus TaxID=52904 RepID=A0A2U9C8Z9_SCOMX|nr:putative kinetochore protein Spc25 isoform 4 [Scophthalmus maximus]
MTSITDPNMSVRFTGAMEEIHNKQLKTYGEIMDTTTELCQSHRQFVKSALDMCLKKCKDDEMLFETIQTFKIDLEQKNSSLKEKQHDISEVISEIQQKEMQKDEIIQKIEKLKEEQAKRKESNKDRLRNLQKARLVFQDHLGMEIRTILGKTQLVKGEKLQFVFRNINPSDQESAYVVTLGIKEDGAYQIVSSDPVLECLPALESRLQETNNLPAFLANVRKEFISQARS